MKLAPISQEARSKEASMKWRNPEEFSWSSLCVSVRNVLLFEFSILDPCSTQKSYCSFGRARAGGRGRTAAPPNMVMAATDWTARSVDQVKNERDVALNDLPQAQIKASGKALSA